MSYKPLPFYFVGQLVLPHEYHEIRKSDMSGSNNPIQCLRKHHPHATSTRFPNTLSQYYHLVTLLQKANICYEIISFLGTEAKT